MVEWPKRRIGDLCEVTSSKRIFASDYVSEGVPFYRSKEIGEKHRGNLKVATELFISRAHFNQIVAKFGAPKTGDLLLTSIGALLGLPYVVREGEEFYFKDGNLTWFRSFNGLDISVEHAFDMRGVSFLEPPGFRQSSFKEAPDFDDVKLQLPGIWRGHKLHDIGNYRHIRRLAIRGLDHENEIKAFKGEVRSKRGTEHHWYHAAFWYGLAYDVLSDFGRSMSRPLAVWFVSLFAFAAIYFLNAGVSASEWFQPCVASGAPKALQAVTLSIANALPGIGSSRTEEAKAFYACLSLPYGPPWSPIFQICQTLWSTVLIFLFLLAVRNQFKIK